MKESEMQGDSYATPSWLMDMFDGWFDPCPLNENPDFDGLSIEWKDKTYVNPPYSEPLKWVEKAIEQSKKKQTYCDAASSRFFNKVFSTMPRRRRSNLLWKAYKVQWQDTLLCINARYIQWKEA